MKGTIKFNDYLKSELKNPKFKKEFDRQDPLVRTAIKIAMLREKHHMTQKGLAKKLHTSQAAISRIERGDYNPSLETIEKIAEVFHKRIELNFV